MNARISREIRFAVLGLLIALPGCSRTDELAPPELSLGRDECVECGMIITEDRFSCAMIVVDGGHVQPQLFDDIGDLVDYEKAHPELDVKRRYVHDYHTRAWIAADSAAYAACESVHTPMGSWLAAFASKAAAEEFARAHSGRTFTFEQLPEFRKEWRQWRLSR